MTDFLHLKISKLKIFYFLILGIFFIVFIILSFLNSQIRKQNISSDIYITPLTFSSQTYPEITYKYDPIISAQGAIVLDRNSQVTLFEKNPKLRFSPASTTKIMTALVALEYYKPEDVLTIQKTNIEGSVIGFKLGEKLSFENLFYAMMLPSSNDATIAIAQNYPGGEVAFVARMNEKAKELHLKDTYFEEPIGLLDERDYTTATDLARLADIALDSPYFAKVVSTKSIQIRSLNGNSYNLFNLNRLLDLPGINGVKTGFTEGAGQVLVTSKNIEDKNAQVIIVVMQSLDRFGDTEAILNYLENNITYQSIRP